MKVTSAQIFFYHSKREVVIVPYNCIQPYKTAFHIQDTPFLEQISVPLAVDFACRKFAYWKVEKGFGNLERVV